MQVGVGEALDYLLKAKRNFQNNEALYGVIFSYACFIAESTHFQLNLRGLNLLKSLLDNAVFKQSAAQVLCNCYDGQSPHGKQVIINSIAKIRTFDPELAENLRSKVLCDNTTTAVRYLERIEMRATDI